jgi:two-component system CheB/CheR fusion protein
VKPIIKRSGSKAFLITFEELDQPRPEIADNPQAMDLGEASRNRVDELELELRYSKENLQAAVEELETSNEELQATNEELVASNEELQSTNEELHSVNEELYTVNAEYQKKITELTELTNDMNNLLVSTEVHTLFLDNQLCIRKFTPKMAEVFNLVPHDFGRRIDSFAHNILCDDLAEKLSRVLETGELYEQRVTDNQQHHFLMRLLPYRAGDDTDGVVLTLIDVSSLVAAQDDVLRERERFERVIAANRDGIWDWPDVDSDEMWWSPACYRMLGYEQGELKSRYSVWMNLIHPEDREKLSRTTIPHQDQCFVELHRDFEYRMKHKSGQYRWYHHRAIIDEDEQGRPFRMTGSVADIHDRKCTEMESVEEIRRRDDFLAMLSHELRNPMGAVLNAIQLLDTDKPAAANSAEEEVSQLDAMKIIDRQTRHMARLLDDLLDVARFGQSKIEFRKEYVDLCQLADDVLEAIRYEVDAKNQTLRANICDGPLCVFADPARIKQAQVNLLTNASKYTPESTEICYFVERDHDEAVITVRDSGEGIPRALLGSIFDLFVQADNSLARPSGGMGVGLSLARTIVEAHDGSIAAESEGPGKGSSFQIRLPISRQNPKSAPPAPHFQFQGCKLLLVEDNDDARSMLARGLQLQGFVVEQASDGRQALIALRSFRPEVAVIDIGLPGMSGYEVARQVRSSTDLRDTTLIALTGYGRQTDRKAALDAGFDTHLVKPLNPSELYSFIANRQTQRGPSER